MHRLAMPLQSLLTAAVFSLIALCGFTSAATATEVIEFYNTNLDNYFITSDSSEAAAIDNGSAGPGWSRTGNAFASGGSTSVCRFYGSQSPGPNSHFYTVDPGECAGLRQLQATTPATKKRWNFESLDFVSTPATGGACPAGLASVYRAYNNGFARGVDSNHRITGGLTAIQQLVDRGWTSEGVVMCAPSITCSGGINGCGSAAAAMTIRVTVPSNTPAADTIWLRQLNAGIVELDIQMTKVGSGPDVWQASVPAPQGTIFRYLYRRGGDWNKTETYPPAAADGGFFYREVLARGGTTVDETVAQWKDLPPISGSTGTLQGLVTSSNGSLLMGIRVSAGPHQVITRWDGSYRVLGVPAGPIEITFQADSGEYLHTRTSATVSSSGATTVNATLTAAVMVTVTFQVTVPDGTPPAAIPRLYGDTYRLGMFQEYFDGMLVNAPRVLDMARVSGTTWSYTANLGAGTCVNYTYTLGAPNRMTNNDVRSDGKPVVRSLCASGNMTVNDTVTAWKAPLQVPVTLSVTSPTTDVLYVTADDCGGCAPMRMWSTGTGTASYVIYADPNTTLRYRYMRNGSNELGMEILPPGDQNPPLYRSLAIGPNGATSSDTITAWRHQMRETALTTVQTGITGPIVPRLSGSFQTGVEFIDYWRAEWQALIRPSVARLKSKNVKWVQIAPGWGIMSMDTPRIEQGWGNSLTTEELIGHIREVRAQGLNVALRPVPFPASPAAAAGFSVWHSNEWYDLFFDEVKAVYMFHARIAQQEGVELLFLDTIAWDFAAYADVATTSATRAYINSKYKSIIAEIRAIAPSVKLSTGLISPFDEYDWYGELDYLGDKWWVPLATTDNASVAEMYAVAMDKLKTYYQPLSARFSNKPFLFAEVAYYSANASAMQQYAGNAREIDDFSPAVATPVSDHDEQARAYQATLLAFAATPWVQGCYSFGYAYFDLDPKSYSIRSKTAEEIMSQIYQKLNGM